MSISDMIVVMKDGVLQQIGKPQEVYDNPKNLFVAKFLGTPPINVFEGRVEDGQLLVCDDIIMDVPGLTDRSVIVGIRPEGFEFDDNGSLVCDLVNVEVMGRDISVVSKHSASCTDTIRSIVDSDCKIGLDATKIRYRVKRNKCLIFDKDTHERIVI